MAHMALRMIAAKAGVGRPVDGAIFLNVERRDVVFGEVLTVLFVADLDVICSGSRGQWQ